MRMLHTVPEGGLGAKRGAANHALGLLLQETGESMAVHKSSLNSIGHSRCDSR